MRNRSHRYQKPLQFDAPVLDERRVVVVRELLHWLLGQRRKHVAQMVALHVLFDLRVEFGKLAETSGR